MQTSGDAGCIGRCIYERHEDTVGTGASAVVCGGQHVGEVKTTLAVEDYDEERAQQALAFLRDYCGEDCTGLVEIDGVTYRIVDIGSGETLRQHQHL